MLSHVSIISLLFFFTAAHAAPRYVPPAKRSKCERSLVSDVVEQRVQDLAVQISELIGDLKVKAEKGELNATPEQAELFAKQLYEMKGRVVEIRENFTVSGADIDGLILGLKEQMHAQLPKIKVALDPKATKNTTTSSPSSPRNFKNREIFGFDPELADWTAPDIEDYLRQPHAPMAEPKRQEQARPQVLGPRPVVHGPEGYRPQGLWEKP